jgi:Glycosyl hydrolases family 2
LNRFLSLRKLGVEEVASRVLKWESLDLNGSFGRYPKLLSHAEKGCDFVKYAFGQPFKVMLDCAKPLFERARMRVLLQVPQAHVTYVTAKTLEPGVVAVAVRGSEAAQGLQYKVRVLVNGMEVAAGKGLVASDRGPEASNKSSTPFGRVVDGLDEGSMGQQSAVLNITTSKPRMWSPDDPFLYDLEVVLEGADAAFSIMLTSQHLNGHAHKPSPCSHADAVFRSQSHVHMLMPCSHAKAMLTCQHHVEKPKPCSRANTMLRSQSHVHVPTPC